MSAETPDEAPVEITSLEDIPLPEDAAGWRTLLAQIPPKQLLRDVRADANLSRAILQGFRVGAEVLKNPVVIGRIVEAAQRNPGFAQVLAANALIVAAQAEEAAAAEVPLPAPKPPTISSEPKEDPKLKEKLKELRSAVQARESQLTELQGQLAALQRERDTTRTELEAERKARQSAEITAEKEKRRAERESRRVEKPEKVAEAPRVRRELAPTPAPVASALPAAFDDAMRRLLNRGKYSVVAEVCREILSTPEGSASERGLTHGLAALALYGLSQSTEGEEQDRLAVGAYLDAGLVSPAAEAFGRLLAHGNATTLRPAEGVVLTRLLALAQKLGHTDEVQSVFDRLRVTAPAGFARLRKALAEGKKPGISLDAPAGGLPTAQVGADEIVALPVAGKTASTVTPRLLAQAVDRGDENFITCARDGIQGLRESHPALADALLQAVVQIQPLAVVPLTNDLPRPVVVDASNVARFNPDPLAGYLPSPPPPSVGNLLALRDYLLKRGFFPVLLIADANLRYHVDNRAAYEALLERGIVQEVAGGTSADLALLTEARNHVAPLVSNDRMTTWGEQARRIERLGFDIVPGGRVLLTTL